MTLISSVEHLSFTLFQNSADKRSFTTVAGGKENFSRDTAIDIKPDMSFCFLGITMADITELVQARHAVDALNEELEQPVQQRTLKLEQAQNQLLHSEKLAAIGTLATSIAHELNNPLQGILN